MLSHLNTNTYKFSRLCVRMCAEIKTNYSRVEFSLKKFHCFVGKFVYVNVHECSHSATTSHTHVSSLSFLLSVISLLSAAFQTFPRSFRLIFRVVLGVQTITATSKEALISRRFFPLTMYAPRFVVFFVAICIVHSSISTESAIWPACARLYFRSFLWALRFWNASVSFYTQSICCSSVR